MNKRNDVSSPMADPDLLGGHLTRRTQFEERFRSRHPSSSAKQNEENKQCQNMKYCENCSKDHGVKQLIHFVAVIKSLSQQYLPSMLNISMRLEATMYLQASSIGF